MRCPCRKKSETVTYADCCQPYHLGTSAAPTAEALMRSRYAAFSMLKEDYLLQTWHSTTRPTRFAFMPGQVWIQLRVLATHTDGDSATVEFEARSRIGGRTEQMHEVSQFRRVSGRWVYLSGRVD